MARLGNPQHSVPPVIHVAGTNGKGSTVAYLRAILEAAGHRVHAYTSPHLVRFNERIRLAGELIDDAALSDVLEECEAANGGEPITLFEITTAAAFLAFSRVPADVLLLEVGLGGRFDATNVIDRPLACVITPVSIDHVAFLGDTIEKIAFEKAGTIKPGVPVIVGPQDPRAFQVIADRAAELGAPMTVFARDYSVRRQDDGLVVEVGGEPEVLPLPSLPGAHQIDNAAVAVAVARAVAGSLSNTGENRAAGLRGVSWPARMQRLTRGPLVERLPAGWSLWLDGGHNADAGRAVSAQVASWRRERPDEPVHLIVGMLNTKAADDYLRPFAGLPQSVSTVTIPGETASLSAEALAAMAGTAGVAAAARDDVAAALEGIVAGGGERGRVLIAGSLYLAGRILAENG
ncbi:folylpolyglutamate synthase/dihydrofolate synthase family protein [Thalassobaculum sp. OXR-137]|uniref:bifunctional folylpolyglutamate synthase/dihydrofolate synthase n=1 Tax=Thalassobaculum sp. OXR-137 TaxID=3100173 RepID=UPI002AC91AE3|nr:folylpolyglutamate synthase/dihydrofolate synthase family protein [Thalassobaculum sp. OXR-137]WPZ37056.1 folylpolyglutamate synthase/dihydrofolate synthase family protein [Thalassobaculum sp. OXR-137]